MIENDHRPGDGDAEGGELLVKFCCYATFGELISANSWDGHDVKHSC